MDRTREGFEELLESTQHVLETDEEDIVRAILERQRSGVDVVYECAGQQETLDEAIEILRPGGTLMLIGIPRDKRVSFVVDKMRRKEIY